MKNVKEVVARFLCTSCGACMGVCPQDAIEMSIDSQGIYVPEIREENCTECGLCVQVCPGHGFDYVTHHKRIHGKLPEHIALGPYRAVYAGYTNVKGILNDCQSGGFVSTALLSCLEDGYIDGAAVSKWREDSPFKPATYIARNKREVMAAVGSKYNPVPAAKIIATLLNGSGRYAFVGTSCQIQAMRKAEAIFPELSQKVVLYIGLHCLGVFTYHFHEQMCHKIGRRREDIVDFRHRSKAWRGWPCDMRMKTRNGDTFDIAARESRLDPRPFFTAWRCQLCFDKANEFSDISCGDCRMPSMHSVVAATGYRLTNGLSEIVVRTERGERVMESIIARASFKVWPASPDALAASIGSEKKLGIATFARIARLLRVGIPEYEVNFYHPVFERSWRRRLLEPSTFLYSLVYYIFYMLGRHRRFRGMVKRIPHRVFGLITRISIRGVYWRRLGKTASLGRVPCGGGPSHSASPQC